jgi:P27 family predicted phage terminase small subunit
MGARGPKPKATVVQLAKGDPGKRAAAREGVEPMPETAIGESPEFLGEAGAAMWRAQVGACAVASAGVGHAWLTAVDRAVLAAYCLNWGLLCEVAVDAQGAPVELAQTKAGLVRRVSASVKVAQLAMQGLKSSIAELGFSPSARARLTLGPKGDAAEAEFEAFLNGGKGA